jgi:hypothetical protein
VIKIRSRFDRISFAIHLRASEFQARDKAETVAFDGVADVEVVDPAGVKVEMGPGNWAAKPPSTASAELISEKEIVRANVPNKSRGLCFSLCTAILFLMDCATENLRSSPPNVRPERRASLRLLFDL